jgi:hypothetical protein
MSHFYRLTVVFFLLIWCKEIAAQTLQLPGTEKKIVRCYTTEIISEFRKKHPQAETDAQFETWLSKKNQDRKAQRAQVINYTIPIIFHVISKGNAADDISATAINEQLLQLNKDFANLANSQYAAAAPTGIQFVLAKNDTLGSPLAEPGIQRINSSLKGWTDYATAGWTSGYIDTIVKPATVWPADKYFNVWIIPSIVNQSSTLLGYSTFPASSGLSGLSNGETNITAGVVVQTGTIGSTFLPKGCGSYGLGKTLTHESGHFFGLRHIWGDANCGNDFCGDTPVHFTSNSGVPTHPKSNSCGTPDEMFENYMDYSDDIVLNTFTSNQADRMQTVMLNSPRRVTVASSPVGAVTVAASNKISFINCTGALKITETGITTSYPRYKDVDLTLNVEDKATGSATVTVTTLGTAVNNFHYQVMTPTLTFATGDNFKDVKIRIFDNAEIDGDKTIVVGYSISSGTGVSTGSSAQSVTITIKDDDNQQYGSNAVALLNEDFGSSGGTVPAGWLAGSFRTPAGFNTWKVGSNGGAGITGQALYVTNDKVLKPLAYSPDSTSDAVAISPLIHATGYSNPTLSFTYKCNGEADSNGTYDYGLLMYSYNNASFFPLSDAGGNAYTFQGVTGATGSGNIVLPTALVDTSFTIGFRWINDDNTGTNPPFLVDDVKVTATPYPIETTVSSSYGFNIRSGATANNFKSTNGNAIVFIKNASTNLTDVTAQITQAGSGTTGLVTTGGAFVRTQKVFQVSPAAANTTTTYQATFYFTEAELAAWGSGKLTLKILKVKDGIDLSSTLNAGNAELINAVVFEDAAAGYITYTGNFTGFSQFMLVSPATALPVTLNNFAATPKQKDIALSWTTDLEINNLGFMVERSLDGSNFKEIGWVKGNGTTSLLSKYVYTDHFVQPGILYYYRIRQLDIDNQQQYSIIRNARINQSAVVALTISPNPAKDFLNLFISGTSNLASVELINALGQKIIQKNQVNAFGGIYQLALKGVARGIYTVVVQLPEGVYTAKAIIE